MCRLFGSLSVEPSNMRKYLIDDPCSLYVQSKVDPKKLQGDGWGIGFYMDGDVKLVKSEKAVYEDYVAFSSTIDSATSQIIIAHIRQASNPRGLPREKIISVESSQPFTYKNFLFAHNGVVRIPDEVIKILGRWRQEIKGFNDSEVYFWFIVKEIVDRGSDVPSAIRSFRETLNELWERCRDNYPQFKGPYEGLNMIFSDGKKLYAYAKYTEEERVSKSICYKDQPSLQMSYIHSEKSLIVASEKTNREDNWLPLKSGELLTAQIINGKVEIEIEKV